MPRKSDLKALRNLISEAHLVISTTSLPEGRSERASELLDAAIRLADVLISEDKQPPAAVIGAKGGKATAKKLGSDHFRQLAAMRKNRSGGRPRKDSEQERPI